MSVSHSNVTCQISYILGVKNQLSLNEYVVWIWAIHFKNLNYCEIRVPII